MSNDPRDLNGEKLRNAMSILGKDLLARQAMISFLKKLESEFDYAGSIRDDVVGPILDAIHDDNVVYHKELQDGTCYDFYYRTKIARDFLLSEKEKPSHVWEPQTTKLLKHLASISSHDILIGGAYFGDHAILIAKLVASDNRFVHCFEPNADQHKMLVRNIELNRLSNVKTSSLGLWHQSSASLKLTGFDSFANAVSANDDDDDSFKTITIDEYLSGECRDVSVIMLDIEGAELNALKGAELTLKKDRPFIVFEVHRDYVNWDNGLENAELCIYLAQLGYKLFAIRDYNTNVEIESYPIELIDVDKVYLQGPPHGFNMLAFPIERVDDLKNPIFRFVENVSPKLLKHKDPLLFHPIYRDDSNV